MNSSAGQLGGLATAQPLRGRRARWFYTALPLLMAAAIFVGFSPTYYLKGLYDTPALSSLYHVHGLLFTCWMLLIVGQPLLVSLGRTDLHRRVGSGAALLVAAMVAAAYFVTVDLGRRGAAPPGVPPLVFLIVPFATLIVFPAFVGSALWWRTQPDIHKRLMLIATLELVPAGIGRWPAFVTSGPLVFFGLTDTFLLAMLIYDRATRGRFHRATLFGGAALVASQALRVVLGGTDGWQALARWLIG